ncbi:hypothetical protein C4577_04985 [Candidatus Parcubacteria bacterium]|nr:MAG: hypothetical protein C4577_04985 [Candidatus Parcubacteria bacterium]
MAITYSRNYELNITEHARERWQERIVDPKRYSHLSNCHISSCETCVSLAHNIRNILTNTRRQIDGRIAAAYKAAKEANNKVTDVNFLKAMEQQHGDLTPYNFYLSLSGDAVFMTKMEGDRNVLVTIMSRDMIEGTTLRSLTRFKNESLLVYNRR